MTVSSQLQTGKKLNDDKKDNDELSGTTEIIFNC